MISIEELTERFVARYERVPRVFSAPGRVNLIGEHTDYNEGFVLPMAIDRRTYVAAAPRGDGRVRCVSAEVDGEVEFALSGDLAPAGDWADYVRGVAAGLLRAGQLLGGADLLVASEVPIGGGLSSSAALEVAAGFAMLSIHDRRLSPVELALLCQRAEQEFAGTQCGIMDQFISTLGVAGQALLIDCRSLEFRLIPMELGEARIVICNSMIRHELASGEYNRRRAECEEAVRRLAGHLPGVQSLRDVEIEEFDSVADLLPDAIRRRAGHVITENCRTLASVEALARGDLASFGRLMFASHASLRDDYEVSCSELDLLVEIASRISGVHGARMTGGGFGGCTVNLVDLAQVDSFVASLRREYQARTGIDPHCSVCRPSGGVREEI
ncbi:MAG: galactokinase [Blastocatellia bacterium]|nr:galactokinase [Blastocatellia bacterium]